jgi:hypothetical protein
VREPGPEPAGAGLSAGPMETQIAERDDLAERQQRNAYVVLLHVYTHALTTEDSPEIAVEALERDLALPRQEARALVWRLVRHGYLREVPGRTEVALTPAGQAYLERGAGRRRSVR